MIEYVDNNKYDYKVADINRASVGLSKFDNKSIENIANKFISNNDQLPLAGACIICSLSVDTQNATLIKALISLGAKIRVCSSATDQTDDDIAATFAQQNIPIFAWNGESWAEYWWCMLKAFDFGNELLPHFIIDENGKIQKAISAGIDSENGVNNQDSETDEDLELVEMIYMSHTSGVVWHKIDSNIKAIIAPEKNIDSCIDKIIELWRSE